MALQEVFPMNPGTMWRSHKPGITLGRAIFLAMMLHLLFVLVLVITDFIPPLQKKVQKISFIGDSLSIMPIRPGAGTIKEGIERKIEVANASPPAPKPTPKVTPKPKKPIADKPVVPPKPELKPEPKKPEALPPVKSPKKTITNPTKKALATPTPKSEEKKEKEPVKDEKKKEIKESPPELADADLPSLPPPSDQPKIEQKGKPKSGVGDEKLGPGGPLPTIGSGEGIVLPGSYLADAFSRISSNFNYPSYYQNQLKEPIFCTIGFRVMLDGKITDIKVEKTSGDPTLDRFAMAALEKTIALLPLKPYITKDIGKDYLGASVPFVFGGTEQI